MRCVDGAAPLDWPPGVEAKSLSLLASCPKPFDHADSRPWPSPPLLSEHVCVMNPPPRQGHSWWQPGRLNWDQSVHRAAGLTQPFPRAGHAHRCAELRKDLILHRQAERRAGRGGCRGGPRRAAGSANERAQSGRRRGTPLRETWLLVRPVPLVSGLLGEGEECYLSCWLSHGGGQREMLLKSITKTLAGLQFTLLGTRASRRCRRSVLRGCRDRSSPRHSVAPASEDPRLPPAAAAPGPGRGGG